MEGLLINAVVQPLLPRLPAACLGWVFPDEGTAALLLAGLGNLVLRYRPPNPIITLETSSLEGDPRTPFQRLLAARCKGRLLQLAQVKLDRVIHLQFEGERGFVETAPSRLIFELTGRNANLVLCDPEGKILGLDREVRAEVNRFRVLRPGLAYLPPPPYQKLDPRRLPPGGLSPLMGEKLSTGVNRHLDGLGKELTRELARRAGLTPETVIEAHHLPRLEEALASLVTQPSQRTELSQDLRKTWEEEEAEALRKPLREALEKRRRTLIARLNDYHQALERLDEATLFRNQADLLLAYQHLVPREATRVSLTNFDETPLEITLERTLSPAQNAERLYQRAKRLEANAERALELQDRTNQELTVLDHELALLATLPRETLRTRLEQARDEAAPVVGLRLSSPAGFGIWVGRNSRENDLLTRSAHSQDLWFHVQGIPGSHVILRTQGRAAPLPDLLFAAQLAAYHSRARGEGSVAVDYTARKYVWRPRKAAPGQVLYSHARTLFVDARSPEMG